MIDFSEVIRKAWDGYDPSRKIAKIEDISAMVSTNRVVKITFIDEDFIIAKLSSFGKYEYFKEDHRIIQALGNNLLYPFENLLAKSLLKNNRVYTYRYKKGKVDMWVVFYNPTRVMQRLPRRLEDSQIKSLGRQIGKFHLACSRIRNVLPKRSKTLRTDINTWLEQLDTNEKKFGSRMHGDAARDATCPLQRDVKPGQAVLAQRPLDRRLDAQEHAQGRMRARVAADLPTFCRQTRDVPRSRNQPA